jgi:hypothetical protein
LQAQACATGSLATAALWRSWTVTNEINAYRQLHAGVESGEAHKSGIPLVLAHGGRRRCCCRAQAALQAGPTSSRLPMTDGALCLAAGVTRLTASSKEAHAFVIMQLLGK